MVAERLFVMWAGPTPRITVTDPKLIKEVVNRHNEFQKPQANAFIDMFVTGLASYNGQKWDHHRKILNPAFHIEKIKVLIILNLNFLFIYLFMSSFFVCVCD